MTASLILGNTFIRLERVQKERDDLREQLKIVTDETLTAEEKAQRMDMLLKEEEARIYDVEKQLARLRETQVFKVLRFMDYLQGQITAVFDSTEYA